MIKPEVDSFFKVTYEDEYQAVIKDYKRPTSVTIDVPVDMYAEILVAAGYHRNSIAKAFQSWVDEHNEVSDQQLSFDFDKGYN